MGEQAGSCYNDGDRGFVDDDAAASRHRRHGHVPRRACREFVQAIFESHAAGGIDLQVAVQLAVVARFYERIGDHAVNIGERVRYIVTGGYPRRADRPDTASRSPRPGRPNRWTSSKQKWENPPKATRERRQNRVKQA